jgi:hypothetical protein
MATQPLTILAAMQGSYIINDTTLWRGKCDAIYVLEDTVFEAFLDSKSLDVDSYISTPATAVKAGALIRPLKDAAFVEIKLTSGSVALVL